MSSHANVAGRSMPARQASALSAHLSQEKLDAARRLSPTQRLLLALELSDTCHQLQRACSPKP
jgi:hypothetical protein